MPVLSPRRRGVARSVGVALVALVALLVAASCGGMTAPSPAPSAPASASARREVALVSAVRPTIVATLDALRAGDVARAKTSWAAYDPAWNGIEVYVNFRSRDLYGRLENDHQAAIDKALAAPQPDVAGTRKLVEGLLSRYDEAIALSTNGPAISPLFDDVATIRITRAPLRAVGPALKGGDLATAKDRYAAFAKLYPDARPLLQRSADAFAELEAAKAKADVALPPAPTASADLGTAFDALVERYNYALGLVNAAARGADLSKTAFTGNDVAQAAGLGLIENDLRASAALWEKADVAGAGTRAARASGARFDAVATALKEKTADAALKRSLDAYAALAGQSGDAAKVRAANKAAIEAVWVAQQWLVGQFWADPTLRPAIAAAIAKLGP